MVYCWKKIEPWFHGQDFRRATKNYWQITELSSVHFGCISCSWLLKYWIFWGLSHKNISTFFFCFGYEIQWLHSYMYSVPKSVLNKISQNRIHMWKSWKVLFFNFIQLANYYLHFYMESLPAGRVCTISQSISISKITLAWTVNMIFFCWSWIFA